MPAPTITSRKQLLKRHLMAVHKHIDDLNVDGDSKKSPPRLIACTSCAKAKTRCDRVFPTCGRCASKGLTCIARTTKRCSDAAFRQARKQLSLLRRPVSIASAPLGHLSDQRRSMVRAQSWDPAMRRPMTDSLYHQSGNLALPSLDGNALETPIPKQAPFGTPEQMEALSDFGSSVLSPESRMASSYGDVKTGSMSDDGAYYGTQPACFNSSPPTSLLELDTDSSDFLTRDHSNFQGAMYSMPFALTSTTTAAYSPPMPGSFADQSFYSPYSSSLSTSQAKTHQRSYSLGAAASWYPYSSLMTGNQQFAQPSTLQCYQNW